MVEVKWVWRVASAWYDPKSGISTDFAATHPWMKSSRWCDTFKWEYIRSSHEILLSCFSFPQINLKFNLHIQTIFSSREPQNIWFGSQSLKIAVFQCHSLVWLNYSTVQYFISTYIPESTEYVESLAEFTCIHWQMSRLLWI